MGWEGEVGALRAQDDGVAEGGSRVECGKALVAARPRGRSPLPPHSLRGGLRPRGRAATMC